LSKLRIAIIGGTGAEGGGLALRFAGAGHEISIGSRDAKKAGDAAHALNTRLGGKLAHGTDNLSAANAGELAVLTVPAAAQQQTALGIASALSGKILIDATVPLMPPKVGTVQLPQGGSAVAALQEALGSQVKVVSAFQNVSHLHLSDLQHEIECDVLVCGDDAGACETVIALIDSLGMRGLYGGPLRNSAAAEALTSVLITLNRKYKCKAAGIRFTGIQKP
jgi:NADPH-dependent F420 reductase